MTTSRPLGIGAIVILIVLCISWALQQIVVKYALPEVGVLTQGAVRSIGATLLVGTYLLARRQRWTRGVTFLGLVAGLLFGAEFLLMFKALEYSDAARVTMFVYTAPFVVAIGSHFLLGLEKLDAKSWFGIALAFVGVGIALGPSVSAGHDWVGDLMALTAGIFWGLTTLLIKGSRLRECSPAEVLFYQLAVSAVMFLPAVFASGETLSLPLSSLSIASLAFQAVWVASLSYVVWFAMVARYSATGISVVTFLTPLFGVAFGVLLLGEPAGFELLFGAAAVATGILLVSIPRASAVRPAGNDVQAASRVRDL